VPRYLVPTAKEFGQLVRGFRKQRGLTQARLAQQSGLLPKTISAIEAGSGQVLLANVMRCLSALDVDLSLDARSGTRTIDATGDEVKHATKRSGRARRTTAASRALKEKW
jgi:HTH-type transcriptional regulator / antitoxin HipB